MEKCRSLHFTIIQQQIIASLKNEEEKDTQEKKDFKGRFHRYLKLLSRKEELVISSIKTDAKMELKRHYDELKCLKGSLEIMSMEIEISEENFDKILDAEKTLSQLAKQIESFEEQN